MLTRLLLTTFVITAIGCGAAQPLPMNACRAADVGDETRPWEHRSYAMTVPWFAPRRGAERPRVVIQAFSDFECPFCARANPVLDQVLEEYGECVQIVWRNYPLRYHPRAPMAARAAIEVYRQGGDDAFWRYHDLLFSDQDHIERADLERHAAQIEGIDMEAFRAVLDGEEHEATLERDRAAIRRLDVSIGTPAFFVNGYLVSGSRPISWFRHAIDGALRARIYGEVED